MEKGIRDADGKVGGVHLVELLSLGYMPEKTQDQLNEAAVYCRKV
jgi:hypothetical protein